MLALHTISCLDPIVDYLFVIDSYVAESEHYSISVWFEHPAIKHPANCHPFLCDSRGDGVITCLVAAIVLGASVLQKFNPILTTVAEKRAK